MATMKIKKGDMVKVIAGKDINSEGKVIAVNRKDGTVLVEGVNMVTKHTKPSMQNQQGGIVHQEGPIDISNVMYLHNGKPTRVGFKMDGDKKVRFAKSTGNRIPSRTPVSPQRFSRLHFPGTAPSSRSQAPDTEPRP